MKVLLSIKPEYVNEIFEGRKKYEFRRTIFKNPDIRKVIIYASAPISKVVGEFEIDEILKDDINSLWELTKDFSGIKKDFYYQYFMKKDEGFAIKIKSFKKYENPFMIGEIGKKPPQSFLYLN